jgi:GNAT superfamily N-acetyltransferase
MRRNPPENVEIVVFGTNIKNLDMSDDDSDFLEQGRDLFEEQGIRISRSEDVCAVAVYRGDVVGAVTLGKSFEEDGYVYTFSAAVDDLWKRKGISRELIKIAINMANEDPFPHYFRVWVVNPHMAALLETLGFDTEGREWSQDSPHMYKYLPIHIA